MRSIKLTFDLEGEKEYTVKLMCVLSSYILVLIGVMTFSPQVLLVKVFCRLPEDQD